MGWDCAASMYAFVKECLIDNGRKGPGEGARWHEQKSQLLIVEPYPNVLLAHLQVQN